MDQLEIENFCQLLEKKIKMQQKRQSLRSEHGRDCGQLEEYRMSLFSQNKEDYFQLEKYKRMIYDHCSWRNRFKYLHIFKNVYYEFNWRYYFGENYIYSHGILAKLLFLRNQETILAEELLSIYDRKLEFFDPVQRKEALHKLFQDSNKLDSKGFRLISDRLVNFVMKEKFVPQTDERKNLSMKHTKSEPSWLRPLFQAYRDLLENYISYYVFEDDNDDEEYKDYDTSGWDVDLDEHLQFLKQYLE